MNPVVHFEMPYDDRERMARFYVSFMDTENNRVSMLRPFPRG